MAHRMKKTQRSQGTPSGEWFETVDEAGRVIGRALRSECHGNPALIHAVVHVLVFNAANQLFLQKRGMNKDIQPGKWDTSVGGHMKPGESPEAAARREMAEELGCPDADLHFAYQYLWRSAVETELVRTFYTLNEGPFQVQADEIDEGRFWSDAEILAPENAPFFTPNILYEYERFNTWRSCREIS